MAIPDYQTEMLPLLRFLQDKHEHSLREAVDSLAEYFGLTEEDRKKLLPSGRQAVFHNRVGWARTYLGKAGLLEGTRRGYFRITERGLEALAQNPDRIDVHFLEQYEEFREFQSVSRKRPTIKIDDQTKTSKVTPEEALESAYQNLRDDVANDLLVQIRSISPNLFEKIVVDLLVRMGYGGSRQDAGEAIGKSGDEGVDGIIKEDRLGLDIIYVQAKKWESTVGRPEIQRFAGALQGKRARKGIFITTSSFSREAIEYASRIETKIVLIDGETLAQFMIDNNLGVSPVASYEVKRIDSDYFAEE
jgi:restriction system protein